MRPSHHEMRGLFRTIDPCSGRVMLSRADAEFLNRMIDEAERLGKWSGDGMILVADGPEGRQLSLGSVVGSSGNGFIDAGSSGPPFADPGFFAQLRGSSGAGTSPYGFDEQEWTGTGFTTLSGGRSGNTGATEANGVSGLGGEIAYLYPLDNSNYLFQWIRGPACGPCGNGGVNLTLTINYLYWGGSSGGLCATASTTETLSLVYQGVKAPVYNPVGLPPGDLWATSCWTPNPPGPSAECASFGFSGPSCMPVNFAGGFVWVFELYCHNTCQFPALAAYGYYPSGNTYFHCDDVNGPRCCDSYPSRPPSRCTDPGMSYNQREETVGIVTGDSICGYIPPGASSAVNSIPVELNFNTGTATLSPLHLEWNGNPVTSVNCDWITSAIVSR